jgi:hypothetical protein
VLDELMRGLTERERRVVRFRFREDLRQSQIGEVLGMSQMQVSRTLRSTLAQMQETATRTHRAHSRVACRHRSLATSDAGQAGGAIDHRRPIPPRFRSRGASGTVGYKEGIRGGVGAFSAVPPDF